MKYLMLALSLVIVSAVACTDQLGAVDLTAGNNGASVEVTSGQVMNIKLESNVTTGYKWTLVDEPQPAIVRLLSSRYDAPVAGGVGAGGNEVWQFQAVGRGTTSLKLAYARSFEPNNPPAKEFALTINVR
jgi:inhibitor of cysteine peptidase